jgi:hypothetical protein
MKMKMKNTPEARVFLAGLAAAAAQTVGETQRIIDDLKTKGTPENLEKGPQDCFRLFLTLGEEISKLKEYLLPE